MILRNFVLVLAVCLCLGLTQVFAHQASNPFHVDVKGNGGYDVIVGGDKWLSNGSTFFNNDGIGYCTGEGTLNLLRTETRMGKDDFGVWNKTTFVYKGGNLVVNTAIKVYSDPEIPVAVFSQRYNIDATKTQGTDADDVISSFPSFRFDQGSPVNLSYLAYGGEMAGWNGINIGRWNKDSTITTGIHGGPLVLFDNSSNVLVISPLSKFMAASNKKIGDKQISWGIMGLVDKVPADFTVDFLVSFSDKGINQAMRDWGAFMTRTYGKTTKPRDSDLTVTHLGYWTDRGAYYYYHKKLFKSYEETMVDVATYLKDQGIPVRYLQIDSWFYSKGLRGGTRTWEPEKRVFPHGFKGLYEKTKLPIACHNRYWDRDTPYAKYNGGKYNFIRDKKSGYSLPDDQQFWVDLFNSTENWGKFILYEQDHLNEQTVHTQALLSDLDLGRRWLMQMGQGAEKFGISIQYCLSYGRHILQSVEIPAVTQARVSGDYNPGNDQYKLGITTMFTDPLNLAAFKDTFWSTSRQIGAFYIGHEKRTELQTRIATLSGGPVGPGDGIGHANAQLLRRCCDSYGKILRGSRALTIMDKSLHQIASNGGFTSEHGEVVYSTISNITGYIFGIIIANEVVGDYRLVPTDLSPHYGRALTQQPLYIYNETAEVLKEWSAKQPLPVNKLNCGDKTCVFHSTPVFQATTGYRLGLLGETDKFARVSPQRFSNIHFSDGGLLQADVTVNPGEAVKVRFFVVAKGASAPVLQDVECLNSSAPGPVVNRAYVTSSGVKGCKVFTE